MPKTSRILLVHDYYQIRGGEDVVVDTEVQHLQDEGEYILLYSRNNAEIDSFSKFQRLLLPLSTIFSTKTFHEVRQIIKQNRISSIEVHNTLPLISPSVYYAAWAEGIPVTQVLHNFRLLCPGATFYRDGHVCEDCVHHSLWNAIKYKCYRNSRTSTFVLTMCLLIHRALGTWKRINQYIALTEYSKLKFASLLSSDKILVKPNSVMPTNSNIPIKDRSMDFIYVGRLDKVKGVWLLLDAFRRLPERQLWVVGSGPEESAMKDYIQRNVMIHVHMVGSVDHTVALEMIADSKVLLMPTLCYETYGLTVKEALVHGTYVIASNIGSIGHLLSNVETAFLFTPNSVEEFINCINNIYIYINEICLILLLYIVLAHGNKEWYLTRHVYQ
ncbi:glycosyl transferase [Clostridia bacterium]|nr:glycosyl transferase [Clostridia bacterium]